jgi:hypothetical protein
MYVRFLNATDRVVSFLMPVETSSNPDAPNMQKNLACSTAESISKKEFG